MPKLVERTASLIASQPQMKQESIRKAILGFLKDLEATSKSAVCLKCGSVAGLRRITVSLLLAEDGEVWEMSLPVCESCIPQDGVTSRLQKESSPAAQIQAENGLERRPSESYRSSTAQLASQMEAIHAANMQYWRRGATASPAERSQYQDRQERLEEIRVLTETSSRGAGRRSTGRAGPKEWLQ